MRELKASELNEAEEHYRNFLIRVWEHLEEGNGTGLFPTPTEEAKILWKIHSESGQSYTHLCSQLIGHLVDFRE